MIILYIIGFLLGIYLYTNYINIIIHGPDSNKIKRRFINLETSIISLFLN